MKTAVIHIRVTPEEKKELEAKAKETSLPLATYLRLIALRSNLSLTSQ